MKFNTEPVAIDPPKRDFIRQEHPCKCGYIPGLYREEFEIYTLPTQLSPKQVLRCKTCKEISLISVISE